MGDAVMGTGIVGGEKRAEEAAHKAISSPLLEEASVQGAKGVIINITGGEDMSLVEVNEASSIIREADPEANIIFGAVVDPRMQGRMKITVIATGFHRAAPAVKRTTVTPVDIANYKRPAEMAVGSEGFYRKGSDGLSMDLDFGIEQEGGEDLDVPTFLRKGKGRAVEPSPSPVTSKRFRARSRLRSRRRSRYASCALPGTCRPRHDPTRTSHPCRSIPGSR